MVDLETLSTLPTATILSIGAALVQNPSDGFYRRVVVFPSAHFSVQQDTLGWWARQDPKIKEEAFGGTEELEVALNDFCKWFPGDAVIWSNGADFDLPILRHALDYYGIKQPWKVKNTGCFRTLKNLFPRIQPLEANVGGPKHVAVWDAKWQAEHLKMILTHLEERGHGYY